MDQIVAIGTKIQIGKVSVGLFGINVVLFGTKEDLDHSGLELEINGGESEFRESTNFNEESNQYELSIEVPGISKEKIKVKANNEFLFVTVDNRKTEEEKPYEKRFSFRQVVDLGKIKAKYNNGLLYIEVPLKESEKQDIPVD